MPTLNLALPYIAAAQSQKHVTHNAALDIIDALLQLAILSRSLAAPPAAPANGARYLVPAAATGAFAGKAGSIAIYESGAWSFCTPNQGWLAYIADERLLVLFDGGAWNGIEAGSLSPSCRLENLAGLGIGTSYDPLNLLSAKLNKALFSAIDSENGGDGCLRFTLNKQNSAAVVSQLYQSNWSGRAEIGLIGSDGFAIHVSPDGSNWLNALSIDEATGIVNTPASPAFSVLGVLAAGAAPARITYNQTLLNAANAFSPAAGRFTAPVGGLYLFSLSLVKSGATPCAASIRKNGASYGGRIAMTDATGQNLPLSGSAVIALNAGDYVESWLEAGALYLGADAASFSGALLA